MQKMFLIRGVPGSGKSTIAKIIARGESAIHLEADMYFTNRAGNYKYDPRKIVEVHEWCKSQARVALELGRSVVVSNTFTRNEYLRPYFIMARERNIIPNVIEAKGRFKNIHGCPEVVVDKMLREWEELDLHYLINGDLGIFD